MFPDASSFAVSGSHPLSKYAVEHALKDSSPDAGDFREKDKADETLPLSPTFVLVPLREHLDACIGGCTPIAGLK